MRIIIIWCAMLCGCAGSGMTPQTIAAVALSNALDRIGVALVEDFRARDKACVDEAKTEAQARLCFDVLDIAWQREQIAWQALRRAHDRWATALEQGYGEEAALASLLAGAFCELKIAAAEAKAKVPLIDDVPISCEEATK